MRVSCKSGNRSVPRAWHEAQKQAEEEFQCGFAYQEANEPLSSAKLADTLLKCLIDCDFFSLRVVHAS
jgi:hypothetical protein